MTRALALAAAAALALFGCPGLADVDVKATPPAAPGAPFVLEARVTLRDVLRLTPPELPKRGLSGRVLLGVRAPRGFAVRGRYRALGRAYELMHAPMVEKELGGATPALAHERWHGFVSHLHTELAPEAALEVTLFATPPSVAAAARAQEARADGGRAEVELTIVAGPAPHYPRWPGKVVQKVVKLVY